MIRYLLSLFYLMKMEPSHEKMFYSTETLSWHECFITTIPPHNCFITIIPYKVRNNLLSHEVWCGNFWMAVKAFSRALHHHQVLLEINDPYILDIFSNKTFFFVFLLRTTKITIHNSIFINSFLKEKKKKKTDKTRWCLPLRKPFTSNLIQLKLEDFFFLVFSFKHKNPSISTTATLKHYCWFVVLGEKA